MFQDRSIVIFPQTVKFESKAERAISSQVYSSHPALVFMSRDTVSYREAQDMFPNARHMLIPDFVTTLIGTRIDNNTRDGILMCIRNDKEGLQDHGQISDLAKKLGVDHRIDITDTTINVDYRKIERERLKYIDDIITLFSKYRLVVTDRYHGVIFSLAANTPVVVLASVDHKIISGLEWFPDNFRKYIHYSESIDAAYQTSIEILKVNYEYRLPPHFNNTFFIGLKERIENV